MKKREYGNIKQITMGAQSAVFQKLESIADAIRHVDICPLYALSQLT